MLQFEQTFIIDIGPFKKTMTIFINTIVIKVLPVKVAPCLLDKFQTNETDQQGPTKWLVG